MRGTRSPTRLLPHALSATAVGLSLLVGACGRNAEDAGGEDADAPVSTAPEPAGPVLSTTTTTPTQLTYVIQQGDSLSIIAERFGVSIRALADFNAISDVHAIKVGQELSIPPTTTTSITGG